MYCRMSWLPADIRLRAVSCTAVVGALLSATRNTAVSAIDYDVETNLLESGRL